VFEHGRIKAVVPSTDARLGSGVTQIAGEGRYLIPGLWDMHVHLAPTLVGPEILPLFLAFGVTGVRDLGSQDSIFLWQREVARGDRVGPRIVATGGMLVSWTTADVAGPRSGVTAVQSEAEARAVIRARATTAQFIKLQDSFLPRSIWLAAAAEAAEHRLPIVAHVPMDLSLREAIDAGLADIEHVIGLAITVVPGEADRRRRVMERAHPPGASHPDIFAGYAALFDVEADAWTMPADSAWRAAADVMARHHVALDPALTDLRALATGASGRWDHDPRLELLPAATRRSWASQASGPLFSPENSRRAETALEHAKGIVGLLHHRGVTILAGTDAGSPFDFPGSDTHSELALLVEAGLSPLDALRAATLRPAEFMGLADSVGTIEVGKVADLVVLGANPLTDVHHTGQILGVVRAGRYFGRAALDSMVTTVKARNR
jgi:Amidohydrolase family